MSGFELLPNRSSHEDQIEEPAFKFQLTAPQEEKSKLRRSALQLATAICVVCFCTAIFALIALSLVNQEFFSSQAGPAQEEILSLSVGKEGALSIKVEGIVWLQTTKEAFVRVNGELVNLSVAENSKKVANRIDDDLGRYQETELSFVHPKSKATLVLCRVKFYSEWHAIELEQHFPENLNGTSVGDADLQVSAWPIFSTAQEVEEPQDRSFAHWVSWFYHNDNDNDKVTGRRKMLVAPGFDSPQIGLWTGTTTRLHGGIGGTGVLAIFDRNGRATVVSPMKNPMIINQVSDKVAGTLSFGLVGNVSYIPRGTTVSVVIVGGNKGINDVMARWGDVMRARSGKPKAAAVKGDDPSLKYLGLTTDNGAYYYYNAPDYYEQILALFEYTQKIELSFRYILLDSWWYQKSSVNNGVKQWTADAKVFASNPDKPLESLFSKTGWWVQAHNRYWAPDVVYAKQNGGNFSFYVDQVNKGSVPTDASFWPWLLKQSSAWGLKVYEQDWLFNELFYAGDLLLSSTTSSNEWLSEMARAADAAGISIQYCMPYIRHLLQSVDFVAVTQARASDDYALKPNNNLHENWRIGGQAVLLTALGLATSKDGFWTTSQQAGNPYGPDFFEPFPRLHSVVATISKGPVQIADGINFFDSNLIYKSARIDGTLLQASTPAMAVDLWFIQKAYGSRLQANFELWSANSLIRSRWLASLLFAASLSEPMQIFPSDLSLTLDGVVLVAFESNSTSRPQVFSQDSPIILPPMICLADFHLWTIVPVMSGGWILLGETKKWVSISESRIRHVRETEEDGLLLQLIGTIGESISFEFTNVRDLKVWSVTCTFSVAGELWLSALRGCGEPSLHS